MKKSLILIFLIIFILNLSLASSICTVNFDNNDPIIGQTIVAIMSCSEPQEQSQTYSLIWKDQNGVTLQTDIGTTPSIKNTNFFESYTITSGVISGNATLTGTNLEGYDVFTVTESNTTLIISDGKVTYPILLGKVIGFNFYIEDDNNNSINNAICEGCGEDGEGVPSGNCIEAFPSSDGNINIAGFASTEKYKENQDYVLNVNCIYDGNGDGVFESSGSLNYPFSINKWLQVNTITDKNNYYGKQEIEICANVTNLIYDDRVNLNIYHQVRCSALNDYNNDTDRNLVISDDNEPDKRGININTTQNQCKKFILPEPKNLQGKVSSCYASTQVEVLDEIGNAVTSYLTTSDIFNLTINDLNINPDWEYINSKSLSTYINLSSNEYLEYSGNMTNGNLDIILYKESESIRHEDQYIVNKIDIDNILLGLKVDNIKANYCNGTEITDLSLEYLNDGNLEIELRNVDITSNGCYNVEIMLDEEGNKMFNTNIALIIEILFFIIIGSIVTYIAKIKEIESENAAFWLAFVSFAMALIEVPLMVGINYANYIGYDVTAILKINFLALSFVAFTVGIIVLFFVQLNVFDLNKLGTKRFRKKRQEKW